MNQNSTFATTFAKYKGPHRHEQFLKEMDQVVPWARLMRLIGPYYSRTVTNRQPMLLELERMLRIYFMQRWFRLSDADTERALYDLESMRRFCLIDLAEEAVPDAGTILDFRQLLERYRLDETVFSVVREQFEHRRPLLAAVT